VGTYYETITVSDTNSALTILPLILTVNQSVVISGSASIQSTSGTAFTSTAYLATLGTGTKRFTYSVSAANAGITIDTSTMNSALIKVATSVIAATYTITLTTTDSATSQASFTVTLVVNQAITFTGVQAQTRKYGATKSATFTVANGSGNKIITFSPASLNYVSWDTSAANTAQITIAPGLVPGTYYQTIIATDSVSATTNYLVTITSTLADTLTVYVDTITTLTYSGQPVAITPTISVTGLVNGDTGASATMYYTGTNSTSYAYSSTKPTNAGTYSVSPVSLALTQGSPTYYTAVTYVGNSLIVNKATQALLRVNNLATLSFYQIANSALSLSAAGGSDSGATTFTVTNGAGTTCTMPTATSVISSTVGTCNVSVSKAGTNNYFSAVSDTATVSFIIYFIPTAPTFSSSSGSILITYTPPAPKVDPDMVPTFASAGYSASINTTLTITGTGFTAINEVDFDSGEVVMVTPVSDTTITLTVPNTAQSGPLILVKTRGNGSQLFARTDFTRLP
jgi:hypothetical protein